MVLLRTNNRLPNEWHRSIATSSVTGILQTRYCFGLRW